MHEIHNFNFYSPTIDGAEEAKEPIYLLRKDIRQYLQSIDIRTDDIETFASQDIQLRSFIDTITYDMLNLSKETVGNTILFELWRRSFEEDVPNIIPQRLKENIPLTINPTITKKWETITALTKRRMARKTPLSEFEYVISLVFNDPQNAPKQRKEIARSSLSEFKRENETWQQYEKRIKNALERKLYPLGEVKKNRREVAFQWYEEKYIQLLKTNGHMSQREAAVQLGVSEKLIEHIRKDLQSKEITLSYKDLYPVSHNIREKIINALTELQEQKVEREITYRMIAQQTGESVDSIRDFFRFHGTSLSLSAETIKRFSFKIK